MYFVDRRLANYLLRDSFCSTAPLWADESGAVMLLDQTAGQFGGTWFVGHFIRNARFRQPKSLAVSQK